jgi:hypothetical protein
LGKSYEKDINTLKHIMDDKFQTKLIEAQRIRFEEQEQNFQLKIKELEDKLKKKLRWEMDENVRDLWVKNVIEKTFKEVFGQPKGCKEDYNHTSERTPIKNLLARATDVSSSDPCSSGAETKNKEKGE